MTCYHPIVLYPSRKGINPKTGKIPLGGLIKGDPLKGQKIPCGRCIGCRLEYSRQWAVRCVHESKMHINNSFLTLTYNDENLTWGNERPTLYPPDLQLFMKRLRKQTGEGVKFFACGEYGEKNQRPHYHMCLFGHDFEDKVIYSKRKGITNYESETLNRIWGNGTCIIGDVNFETSAYVARYIMEKKTGPKAEYYEREKIIPEFVRMSRRPGIGASWYEKNKGDVYPHDYLIIRNGIKCKPVKYYNEKYSLSNPTEMLNIKEHRKQQLEKQAENNTTRRLADRRQIKEAQMRQLVRSI